jgi:hypothetical protein
LEYSTALEIDWILPFLSDIDMYVSCRQFQIATVVSEIIFPIVLFPRAK